MHEPGLIDIPSVPHPSGTLCWLEESRCVPFVIRRVYFITAIPSGAERGGHAHRQISELLVAASGGFTVRLSDPEGNRREFRLDRPEQGLLIPSGWWRTIGDYLPGSVCVVLASGPYDETEYIRRASEFFRDGRRKA